MGNIKVLMLGNNTSVRGGITSVIEQLLNYDWKQNGVEMKFISTYIKTNNAKKIVYFLGAYIRILVAFLFDRPDIVHLHMSYKGSFQRKYAIHKLCRKFGIKDIIHLHGSEFEKWFYEMDPNTQEKIRKLLRECEAFIVLGEKWNHTIKKIEPLTNTVVVSNTIHIPEERMEWKNEIFQVLFLGVLIKRKGVSDLIKAIKILADSQKCNKIHFVIAGTGIEEQHLKEECKKFNLEEYITFAGWTSGEKKEYLLKNSQLLVLPSYNEGLPIAILEAMSYGVPIIATDVGDISSAVREAENGYLISPGDCKKLADTINQIANHKDLFEQLSNESRKIAEKDFSDKNYFDKLRGLYEELAE